MKKTSLIMAVIILLSAVFSIPTHAVYDPIFEETTIDGIKFYYSIIDNKYAEIVDVEGRKANFIPKELGGYPVTIIGSYAYSTAEDPEILTANKTFDLVIPDTVTCIRNNAFYNKIELGTVTIPSSVTYIGEAAFARCVNLRKINIPESVTRIEPYTFMSCASLKKITLHDAIDKIGNSAFLGCESLSKFTVPSNLWTLGDRAFYLCSSLKSIDFADAPVRLGYQSVGYYNTRSGWEGYYYPKETISEKTTKKYNDFKIISAHNIYGNYDNGPEKYASKNGFKYLVSSSSEKSYLGGCYSGDTRTLYIDHKKLTDYKTSNSKIIKLTKNGKLTALQKGTATVKVTLPSGKVYKGTFEVVDNPVLKQKVTINDNNKTKYVEAKTVSVKLGKTVKVKLYGKAKSIDNKYYSTSKAKIISKKSSTKIKIKGITKGTSTVKIKVNGVKTLKLKVKVN